MWTQERSKYVKSRSLRADANSLDRFVVAPAFTLIELLVVVSIIALLISILLPSLKSARESARSAVCGATIRSLANGLYSYTTDSDDWIPGMNTSGFAVTIANLSGGDPLVDLSRPDLPVQSTDWLTPILAGDTDFPNNRAQKYDLLLRKYSCPSQRAIKSSAFPPSGSSVPDQPLFDEINEWVAVSYLMPFHFQLWGFDQRLDVLGENPSNPGQVIRPDTTRLNWEAAIRSYKSRLPRVGPPARKAFVADGTRYVVNRAFVDHDVSPTPGNFGSFTSAGAWWEDGRAYGVGPGTQDYTGETISGGSPSAGANLFYSYRHGSRKASAVNDARQNTGKINILFFDGHVESFGDQASRRIDFWYPTGAEVRRANEGMTPIPQGDSNSNYIIP